MRPSACGRQVQAMEKIKIFQGERELLRGIIETAPVGIIVLDKHRRIRILNRMAAQMLGISGQVSKTSLRQHLIKGSVLSECLSEGLLRKGEAIYLEGLRYKEYYLSVSGRPLMNSYLLTMTNITTLKQMEAQSMRSMIQGQETERKRLSQEIHDGLAPLLSTIKISLEAIDLKLERHPEQAPLAEKLKAIHELITTLAEDMRGISHALMPKVLEDFGIAPALESLCSRLNNNEKVEIHYYNAGFDQRLEKSVEWNLYRIAQELIHNALKHAQANQITIQLIRHSNTVMLMVEDNGCGFDWPMIQATTPGIGLKNIQTRAKMIGASFYIDTSQGKGVTATCELPLNQE